MAAHMLRRPNACNQCMTEDRVFTVALPPIYAQTLAQAQILRALFYKKQGDHTS